ncbi:MAG: hypothetical protein V4726_13985 [Verrucomicrobiota bacterium]
MKKSSLQLIRVLIGAVIGFTAALAARKIMSGNISSGAPGREPALTFSSVGPPLVHPSETAPKALPALEDFRKMTALAKVNLAASLGSLTPIHREVFLKECAVWPEPESTQMLQLLLSRWAETDPGAAADWAFSHLEGRALDCFKDIAQIWAARDGQGLAAWARTALNKPDFPFAQGILVRTPRILERFNPVAMAEFLEMDCCQGFSNNGFNFSNSLRTPEAVKAMASKLPGHVEYISDREELNRQLAGKSPNPRNRPSKNGWNALFEQTAVALHGLSPEDCGAWLAAFPENAQLVARHEIAKAAAPAPQSRQ